MRVRSGDRRGFSLIEVLIGLGIFALLSAGIFTGVQFVFKAVYQSRIRVLESEIVGEHLEIVRNMPFDQIGIVNGLPPGTLERTVTTTRSGVNFTITRTIRNIDDTFDGTIGGSPNDTAPADYKYVEVQVVCDSCGQEEPLIANTIVAPKFLEGSENTGALFIEVFNGSGVAVENATVRVIATSTTPTLDFTDTTDNDGMVRLIGLPPAVTAYGITITKNGYTSDRTYAASSTNPNPIKPPATIAAQQVTQISFSIDEAAEMQVAAVDASCLPQGSIGINAVGTKAIGASPDVLLYNETKTTNGSGIASFPSLVWDNYGLSASSRDVLGSIPGIPVVLQPGVTQPVTLVLGTDTAHSLLAHVRDSVTMQPLSQASVMVTSTGYDVTKTTGVGHVSQTDWSHGGGQATFGDAAKYWTASGVEISAPAGDLTLQTSGAGYVGSATLESSTFDLGVVANPVNLVWEPLAQPGETGPESVQFQIATSDMPDPEEWVFAGHDGTGTTFYDATHMALHAVHEGKRYLRYKLFLSTSDLLVTPTVSTVSVTYTTSCTPPGQAYFGGVSARDYWVTVALDGYQSFEQQVSVTGDTTLTVDLIHE